MKVTEKVATGAQKSSFHTSDAIGVDDLRAFVDFRIAMIYRFGCEAASEPP